MTADDETERALNVGGTRARARAGRPPSTPACFHQVSSVAAAGDYLGRFDETMFDVGQHLPSPYHRTKFESERIVREECTVPWRVYRPAVVVGHSQTGAMDKVDGPYYFFPLLKLLRDHLPAWMPLVGVDLGDTNVVPVDYVATAMDHLAHLPGRDGRPSTWSTPSRSRSSEMLNSFAAAAGAPRFATPLDRRVTGSLPLSLLPRALRPSTFLTGLLRTRPVQAAAATRPSAASACPREVLGHVSFPAVFDSRRTEQALAGLRHLLPDLECYAAHAVGLLGGAPRRDDRRDPRIARR